MKPDWKDAPSWANWLARDKDGNWFWYESTPEVIAQIWHSRYGRVEVAARKETLWTETLEGRPYED